MLIHNKDDVEFVTEFPCFLGHPVQSISFEKKFDVFQQGKYCPNPWNLQCIGVFKLQFYK